MLEDPRKKFKLPTLSTKCCAKSVCSAGEKQIAGSHQLHEASVLLWSDKKYINRNSIFENSVSF